MRYPVPVVLMAAVLCIPGCRASDIPSRSDWTDYGTILEAGEQGQWDYLLWGGMAGSIIKKGGKFYLYYQGSPEYDEVEDTNNYRAIGLATSSDGIRFTKHPSNPLISFSPGGIGEEGAASTGATLDNDGNVFVFYAALTAINASLVNADVRLATSADGVHFTDQGVILDHADPSVWGSGDELGAIIAQRDLSGWRVYYIPNGTPQGRLLGVAWGDRADALTSTAPVQDTRGGVKAWGLGSLVTTFDGTSVIFISDVTDRKVEARVVRPSRPDRVSRPIATYRFDNMLQGIVYLDGERHTWFLYYRTPDNRYGVRLAPAGEADATPPTSPDELTATFARNGEVQLRWSAARDDETGIAAYKVFRDGELMATTIRTQFLDKGRSASGASYQVSAVNFHGTEGDRSTPFSVEIPWTPAATTGPTTARMTG